METVEEVEADSKDPKKRLPYVFEVEDQAPIYTKSPEVCNRDLRRRDLFHASVSETATYSCTKRSALGQLAGGSRLQRERRDPASAPGVCKRDEPYSTIAERGGDVQR